MGWGKSHKQNQSRQDLHPHASQEPQNQTEFPLRSKHMLQTLVPCACVGPQGWDPHHSSSHRTSVPLSIPSAPLPTSPAARPKPLHQESHLHLQQPPHVAWCHHPHDARFASSSSAAPFQPVSPLHHLASPRDIPPLNGGQKHTGKMLYFRGFGPRWFPSSRLDTGKSDTEGWALLAEPWHSRPLLLPPNRSPAPFPCLEPAAGAAPQAVQLPSAFPVSATFCFKPCWASVIKAKCSRFWCLMQTSLQFMCFPSEICFKNNLPNSVFYKIHLRKKAFRRKEIFSIHDRRLTGLKQAAL